jgi:carboxyl-terminal processing protease
LRRGQALPRSLRVPIAEGSDPAPASELELTPSRIRYGRGEVLVLPLREVPDRLGEALAELMTQVKREAPPLAVLLDLRGNGGGSTDGAAGALGVFMPDVPSFPLKRRDGSIEIERTLRPAEGALWAGPLAVLVDGYTASAAEMIAGAVASYRRGPVVGSRTFGKGCIQEYFDDRSGAGVLRLTTMVFALPDGSPIQGVGITPTVLLPLPAAPEREAALPGSFSAWTGPDVRMPAG